MSRQFNAGTDLMTFANIAGASMNDALTLFMLVKILTASDNTWQSLMEFDRSGGGNACGMVRTPSVTVGELGMINTSGTVIGSGADIPISDADGWVGVWITRSATGATSLHKIPVGGSRTTQPGTTVADGLAWNGVLKIGGDEDPANILWKAGAYWNGAEVTTTQIDAVMAALTSASVADLSPTWLADDSDDFATNLVSPGVGDRTAISGTEISEDDPAWTSGLGGGATDGNVTAVPCVGTGGLVAPAVTASAAVTNPALVGTGGMAAPIASGTGNANVEAVTCAGTGALVAATVSATASVTAATCSGTGALPMASGTFSSQVEAPTCAGTGTLAAPTVSGTGDGSVTAVTCNGTGALAAPTVSAGSAGTVNATAAAGTGDLVAPVPSADAGLTSSTAQGTGGLPAPATAAGANVSAGTLAGLGSVPVATITDGITVSAVTAAAVGSLRAPAISAASAVSSVPWAGIGRLFVPIASGTGAGNVAAVSLSGVGELVAPVPVAVGAGHVEPSGGLTGLDEAGGISGVVEG